MPFEVKREGIDYLMNFYRYLSYDRKKNLHLLTTDDGAFLFVNKSSLQQIRRGKIESEELYEKLKKRALLLVPENVQKHIQKTKERYAFLLNGTSLHIIAPTIRCNQHCPYCFASPKEMKSNVEETDMSLETARRTVEFILNSPSPALTLEFTGGEPLAAFERIQEMILYARELNKEKKKDLQFTIVTNLTLMTERIAKWLIEHDVSICTSLDGPKEVHDKNRIIKGRQGETIPTHSKVVKWIKRLQELHKELGSKNSVNALMTITRYSFPYAREIIEEYVNLGLNLVDVRGLMQIGFALEEDATGLQYAPEEFKKFYLECISIIDELQSQGIHIEDRMRKLYEYKIEEQKPTYHIDFESPHGSGIGALAYGPNGAIYSSHEGIGKEEFILGLVEETWSELFKNKELAFMLQSSMLEGNALCDRCALKPYCGTLPTEQLESFGRLYAHPCTNSRHHETFFHARRVFDKLLQEKL
jgi:His-Xaa-Ser system radical SAM maturase HxsB